MIIDHKQNYIIVRDEKEDVSDFALYLMKNQDKFSNKNVVVDLLKYGELTLHELLEFLKLSDSHRKSGHSFVIVNDTINIDSVPEEINVVPTLQEAEDLISLEEIERDLGF